ncbi:MAG: GYD domain-containing protein [FCB group bacterium]|nr:GYD domain-containing protein [FCB group bacterium]
MQTFIALLNFTEHGSKHVKKTTARADAFREMAERSGVKIIHTFWMNGPYDIVHILEVEDDNAAMVHSLSLQSLGNVKTQTFRAYSKEEMNEILGQSFNAFDLLRAGE